MKIITVVQRIVEQLICTPFVSDSVRRVNGYLSLVFKSFMLFVTSNDLMTFSHSFAISSMGCIAHRFFPKFLPHYTINCIVGLAAICHGVYNVGFDVNNRRCSGHCCFDSTSVTHYRIHVLNCSPTSLLAEAYQKGLLFHGNLGFYKMADRFRCSIILHCQICLTCQGFSNLFDLSGLQQSV